MPDDRSYTAFASDRLIATGPLQTVLARTKAWVDRRERGRLLIFDDETGREVDFDLREACRLERTASATVGAERGA